MDMIPVRSSAIFAIGYDPTSGRMKIRFNQGHTYDFCRVPEHVFEAFLNSSSKGRYYDLHIKDRYQC